MPQPHSLTYLGRTNWRDRRRPFGIHAPDRLHHLYVIGQTGTGKSTLLSNLMFQDQHAGHGFAFLDPHGDTVSALAHTLFRQNGDLLIYLDATNSNSIIGFNPLEEVPLEQRALAASGVVEAFRSVWTQAWGPRLEHILRNAVLTLLDQPSATLADVSRLFFEKDFREAAITRVTHESVADFWEREFPGYAKRNQAEALSPLLNKLGALLALPPIHRVLTRPKSGYNLREVLDEGRIFLVNLAKGRIGADGAALLGSLIVSRIGLAGLSRADVPEHLRRHFFLYLDEFHSFTTTFLTTMLSELRKYGVGLVLAHQYVSQVPTEVRDAIFGNVGSVVSFRLGPLDSRIMANLLGPEITEFDLMNLPNHDIYVRLMVGGKLSSVFSAETFPSFRE